MIRIIKNKQNNAIKHSNMGRHSFIYIIILFIIISGCARKKRNVITYDLKRSDYLETIDATGTIQAVNNFSMVAPRVSGLTVAHLAKDGAYVKKGDTICILDSPELIGTVESFNTDLEKMEADLKKLEADNAMELALLKAQVETNKAQMAISILDSIQMKFAPSVKKRLLELEMEKTNVEEKKLQKKFAAQKRIDNSELIQMKSRITIQKNRIELFQNQINSLRLVSPFDGIVMHVEGKTFKTMGGSTVGGKIEEGSKVFSSMPLLQIPEMKEMQVSVEVPESDYKRIINGQKVLIRVESVTNLNTTGKIKRKTLAGKNAEEKTLIKTYEVIISVDSCHMKMMPGLSASCRIIVDQVKDTIVVPAAAIFARDSSKIIYVAGNEKFIPVTVETGSSSSSKSIISKGLTGNETIALTEPPHNLISKEVNSIPDKIINSGSHKNDSVIKSSTVKY